MQLDNFQLKNTEKGDHSNDSPHEPPIDVTTSPFAAPPVSEDHGDNPSVRPPLTTSQRPRHRVGPLVKGQSFHSHGDIQHRGTCCFQKDNPLLVFWNVFSPMKEKLTFIKRKLEEFFLPKRSLSKKSEDFFPVKI